MLQFGCRCFSWSFQLAPVSLPILRSDFLRHHALLVEVATAGVLDADSLDVLSTVSSPSATNPLCAHLQTVPGEIRKLLSEYLNILSSNGVSSSTPKHSVFHDLSMVSGLPVFSQAHRLDPDKLTPWSSPLHMVLEPDETWRPCRDFHCLNTTSAHRF